MADTERTRLGCGDQRALADSTARSGNGFQTERKEGGNMLARETCAKIASVGVQSAPAEAGFPWEAGTSFLTEIIASWRPSCLGFSQ